MPKSPRAKALSLVRSAEEVRPPDTPPLQRGSDEAKAFVDDLKPERFASLAKAIDLLLGKVIDDDVAISDQELSDPWEQFASDADKTFTKHRVALISSANSHVKNASNFTQQSGFLVPNRHIYLETQLAGGANTAINTSVAILRNIPRIASYHSPSYPVDAYGDLARRSVALPRMLAKVCVNQMLAAHIPLTENGSNASWAGTGETLDPSLFTLHTETKGKEHLSYNDFFSMTVPKGSNIHFSTPELTQDTDIKDIPCSSQTVGCPITLLNGRMPGLWNWFIDGVEERSLWVSNGS